MLVSLPDVNPHQRAFAFEAVHLSTPLLHWSSRLRIVSGAEPGNNTFEALMNLGQGWVDNREDLGS
jgi:hypothetical protein